MLVAALVSAACAHGHHAHGFERAEEWAKDLDDPSREVWQRPVAVVATMDVKKGMTVADLGAGTGYFLPYLSRAVGPRGRVLALDVEPDMVRYVRERAAREGLANVEARVVAADDPGLSPGSVDRVLVVSTWHHVAGREAYARKLLGALAPRGTVTVVDFLMDAKHGPPPPHLLDPGQVTRELESAGFEVGMVLPGLPEQYLLVAHQKL